MSPRRSMAAENKLPGIYRFEAFNLSASCFLRRNVAALFARMRSSSGVLYSSVADSGTCLLPRLASSAQKVTNSGGGFFLRNRLL